MSDETQISPSIKAVLEAHALHQRREFDEAVAALLEARRSGKGHKTALSRAIKAAKWLGGRNAKIAVGARREDRLQDLAERLKEQGAAQVYAKPLDVTKRSSVDDFCQGVFATFGQVDILINNAGLALGTKSVAEGDLDF